MTVRSVTRAPPRGLAPVTNCNMLPGSDFRNASDLPEKYKIKDVLHHFAGEVLSCAMDTLDVERDRCNLAQLTHLVAAPGTSTIPGALLRQGRDKEAVKKSRARRSQPRVTILLPDDFDLDCSTACELSMVRGDVETLLSQAFDALSNRVYGRRLWTLWGEA